GETLNHEDLAASFQASVVEVLTTKTMHAARQLNVRQLVVAGGVAANQGLREGLATAIKASGMDLDLIMPPLRLCGDNGAMIGAAAHIELQKQQFADLSLNAVPGLDFPYGA
ncbi:carbamoyltransferase N-terminal domain-containing protein, partial [Clostridioides difficile]